MLNNPRYYLMTPAQTAGVPVDVVALTTDHNVNMILSLRRRCPWISFLHVAEKDAYAILHEQGGIGIGCYAATDDQTVNRDRRMKARHKQMCLAEHARGLDLHKPVVLLPPSLHPLRDFVREVLKVSFPKE